MLEVSFFTLCSGEICGFRIDGHAGYDDYGKDIVCAGVSSVAYMVANTISGVMNIDAEIKVHDDGYMYVRVPGKSAGLCQVLFEGLKNHLIMMEESYPENINVNYEEVK